MRKRPRKTTAVELGNATVFVTRATLDLDRQGRGYYRRENEAHESGRPLILKKFYPNCFENQKKNINLQRKSKTQPK